MPGLGAPRCDLYRMPVAYSLDRIDNNQRDNLWFDVACGDPGQDRYWSGPMGTADRPPSVGGKKKKPAKTTPAGGGGPMGYAMGGGGGAGGGSGYVAGKAPGGGGGGRTSGKQSVDVKVGVEVDVGIGR